MTLVDVCCRLLAGVWTGVQPHLDGLNDVSCGFQSKLCGHGRADGIKITEDLQELLLEIRGLQKRFG